MKYEKRLQRNFRKAEKKSLQIWLLKKKKKNKHICNFHLECPILTFLGHWPAEQLNYFYSRPKVSLQALEIIKETACLYIKMYFLENAMLNIGSKIGRYYIIKASPYTEMILCWTVWIIWIIYDNKFHFWIWKLHRIHLGDRSETGYFLCWIIMNCCILDIESINKHWETKHFFSATQQQFTVALWWP